jgi:hypothetical protein
VRKTAERELESQTGVLSARQPSLVAATISARKPCAPFSLVDPVLKEAHRGHIARAAVKSICKEKKGNKFVSELVWMASNVQGKERYDERPKP